LLNIMNGYLEAAGEEFDLRSVGAAARSNGEETSVDLNEYHLMAAYECVVEQRCMDSIAELLREERLWEVIPDFARSTALRTRVFCMLSCVGCLCHELMKYHQGFPFCIFEVLRDDAAATRIADACPKLLDPWSTALLHSYHLAPGGLASADAKAELLGTLALMRREMCQVEASHASVRRALFQNSVQTHTVLFQHVSAQWIGQRIRKNQRLLRAGCARYSSSSRRRRAWRDQPPKAGGRVIKKGKRGGAWRAFIREQCRLTKGSPNFAELGSQYRQLDPEEKQRLVRLGRAATEAARGGSTHPFGETSRAQERREQREQRDSHLQALALQGGGGGGKARLDEMALASRAPLAQPESGGAATPASVERLLTLRRQLRLQAEVTGDARRKEEDQIVEYYSGQGMKDFDECAKASQFMQHRKDEFIPRVAAMPFLRRHMWAPTGVASRVSAALSMSQNAYHSKLLGGLCHRWAQMHETIDDHKPTEFAEDTGPPPVPPCRQAGRCLCDARGQLVVKFVGKLDVAVKAACPPGSDRRNRLLSGSELVLGIFGQARPPPEVLEDLDLKAQGLLDGVPISAEAWYHIGAHCKSPWRSTFQKGELVSFRLSEGGQVPSEGRLRGLHRYSTVWEASYEADLDMRWCCCLYQVIWKENPLGTFLPNMVDIVLSEPKQDGSPICRLVWCPWKKRPKQGQKRRKTAPFQSGWAEVHHSYLAVDDVQEASDVSDDDLGGHAAAALEGPDAEPGPEDSADDDEQTPVADMSPICSDTEHGGPDTSFDPQVGPLSLLPDGDFAEGADSESDAASVISLVNDILAVAEPVGASSSAAPIVAEEVSPFPPAEEAATDAVSEGIARVAAPPEPVPPPEAVEVEDQPWPADSNIRLEVQGGCITWYFRKPTVFVAVCLDWRHKCSEGCRKHRVLIGNRSREEQGRPLGYLVAWLGMGRDTTSAFVHKSDFPTLEQRQAARALLLATRAGRPLLAKERPRREDEGEEPIQCP